MASIPEDDAVTIEGPAKLRIRARGRDAVQVLLAIAVVGALGYMIWRHDQDTAHQHDKLLEQNSEMIYVLSLSPEERANLKLDMPESLRRKTRHRE